MSGMIHLFLKVFHFLTAYYFLPVEDIPATKPVEMKNILILGGSYAGLSTAHRIFKQASKTVPFKINIVSPNTELYWSMASPRAAAGIWGDEKVFRPIAPGFEQYGNRIEFIVDTAVNADFEKRTVELASGKTLDYDILILATGSRAREAMPFKELGSTEATKEALHDLRESLKKAQSVIVGGGGPTGIELAAEVAFGYGKQKQVQLITSGPALSEDSPPSVQKEGLKGLSALGVKVQLNTRILHATQLPTGQTDLELSDGSHVRTDLYVPAFGCAPNSSYISSKFLNTKGLVVVDDFLKVPGVTNVWGVGDVIATEWKQYYFMNTQSAYISKSIALALVDKKLYPYKATPASSRVLGFSIGPKGTAAFGTYKLPNLAVTWIRKGLFTHWFEPTITGRLF